MKPAWDELAETYSESELVTIADVDCTEKPKGEELCSKIGVSGYPTIKYWPAGGESGPGGAKGKDYSGGRDLAELKKFVEKTFQKPCDPSTLENCDADQKTLIAEYKDKNVPEEKSTLEVKLKAAKAERVQKEEDFKKERKELKKVEKDMSRRISILKLMEQVAPAGKSDEL